MFSNERKVKRQIDSKFARNSFRNFGMLFNKNESVIKISVIGQRLVAYTRRNIQSIVQLLRVFQGQQKILKLQYNHLFFCVNDGHQELIPKKSIPLPKVPLFLLEGVTCCNNLSMKTYSDSQIGIKTCKDRTF